MVAQVHQPVEVVVTQTPAPQVEVSTIPQASQIPSAVIAEPQAQISGLYFTLFPFYTLVCDKECGLCKARCQQHLLAMFLKIYVRILPLVIACILEVINSLPLCALADASYVAMIKYHQQAGRVAEVEQVFNDMQLDAVDISTSTYNLLIQIYSEAGQFDKMDKVYKQMRQSMQAKITSQAKKEAPVAPTISSGVVSQQSPEVPVTLKEQVPMQTSPDLGIGVSTSQVADSPVTSSDKLSARLGEWEPPSQQPAEIVSNTSLQPSTPSVDISTSEEIPSFKPEGLGMERPTEELSPGQLFAQRIGESEKSPSFRGLLKNLSSGKPSEDSTPPKIDSFNFFNLPSTPSPSMGGATAGRGRGAPSPEVGGRAGRGRGVPGGSPPHSKKQDPIGAEPTKVHIELSREEARQRAMALLAKGDEARSQVQTLVTFMTIVNLWMKCL